MRANQRKMTAYHEAGHAVIGRVLDLPCGPVAIIGNNSEEIGYAVVGDPVRTWERGDGPKRPLAEASCISLYAGAEAERVILGIQGDTFGDGPDCDKARSLLMEFAPVPGCSFVGDDVWEKYETKLRRRASQLVGIHRVKIERVAKALMDRGSLQPDEVDRLMA